MTTTKGKIDPVIVAVIERRLYGIVTQVAESLVRTSMSPIFAEARDIGAGLFDKDMRLIALQEYLPAVAGSIIPSGREIARCWKGEIREGDIFAHNDVWSGNSHQPDITVAKPVFYHGEILFWAITKGHHADIGGRGLVGYDPTSRTCWDDGLMLKPVKLYEGGTYQKSVWDIITYQSKLPGLMENDLHCQCGGCTVGERLLKGLLDEYGVETVYAAIEEIMNATERETRGWIEQIPDGVYEGEKQFDHDAWDRTKPVTVRVKVIKKGKDLVFDFSESDPNTPGYMNCSWGNAFCDTFMALRFFLPGEIRADDGIIRCMDFKTKKGTCIDPDFPHAVTMDTCTFTETIFEAIMLALAPAKPEWATAAHGKMSLHITQGWNPRTNRPFAIIDFVTCANGSGATEGYDGWPQGGPTHCCGKLRSPDPEIMELVTPQIVWQNELTVGREGIGKWRGGFGGIYKVQYIAENPAVEVGQGHKPWAVPYGLFGGGNAVPNAPRVRHQDGRVTPIDINTFWDIKAGDIYEQEMQGGAGYGDPLERDPEWVRKDVDDEFLTLEKAKEDYGVILNSNTLEVDVKATQEERKRRKAKKH